MGLVQRQRDSSIAVSGIQHETSFYMIVITVHDAPVLTVDIRLNQSSLYDVKDVCCAHNKAKIRT